MERGQFFDMMVQQGDQLPSRAQSFLALSFPDGLASVQVIEASDLVVDDTKTQRICSYIESAKPFWITQTMYKNAAGTTIGVKNEYTETKPAWFSSSLSAALGV